MRLPLIFAACALALLAACGGPAPDASPGGVRPPRFGDADPHPWTGGSPHDHAVHGIDTSRFQGLVDWPTARAAGVSFAFLKATEGGDRVDPMFLANWRAAGRAGVPRGAYHFHYHCRPAAEQARWFIANVPRTPGALPPVLDMEWTPFSPTCTLRPAASHVRAEAEIFLDALERHYGQRPLLYTSIDFYRDNQMWRVPRTEYWLRSVAAHPAELYGGRPWTFWQYTSTGLVPGSPGKTDINVFHGSAAAWADWLASRTR